MHVNIKVPPWLPMIIKNRPLGEPGKRSTCGGKGGAIPKNRFIRKFKNLKFEGEGDFWVIRVVSL